MLAFGKIKYFCRITWKLGGPIVSQLCTFASQLCTFTSQLCVHTSQLCTHASRLCVSTVRKPSLQLLLDRQVGDITNLILDLSQWHAWHLLIKTRPTVHDLSFSNAHTLLKVLLSLQQLLNHLPEWSAQ